MKLEHLKKAFALKLYLINAVGLLALQQCQDLPLESPVHIHTAIFRFSFCVDEGVHSASNIPSL
jgi:hypothetical protein